MALLWGELPRRNSLSKTEIRCYLQKLQIELPLRGEVVLLPMPEYHDANGRKVSVVVWLRQPRKHPRGPIERAESSRLGYSTWRARYEQQWARKRLEAGLPCEILNPVIPARRKTA